MRTDGRSVGQSVSQSVSQTHDEAHNRLCNFVNAPKMSSIQLLRILITYGSLFRPEVPAFDRMAGCETV
jgi:hypothetical protein